MEPSPRMRLQVNISGCHRKIVDMWIRCPSGSNRLSGNEDESQLRTRLGRTVIDFLGRHDFAIRDSQIVLTVTNYITCRATDKQKVFPGSLTTACFTQESVRHDYWSPTASFGDAATSTNMPTTRGRQNINLRQT